MLEQIFKEKTFYDASPCPLIDPLNLIANYFFSSTYILGNKSITSEIP